MKTVEQIKNGDVIKRIVARCIASKTWRSECTREATAEVGKADRPVVEAYVREEYEAAGAGFNGRWQS